MHNSYPAGEMVKAITTLKSRLAAFCKTKPTTTFPSNWTPGHLSQRHENTFTQNLNKNVPGSFRCHVSKKEPGALQQLTIPPRKTAALKGAIDRQAV